MQQKKGHLISEERHVFYAYLQEGYSLRAIAKKMQRAASSLSEELNKNGGRENYKPEVAHFHASLRKWESNRTNPLKNDEVWNYVIKNLDEELSPKQISGRLKSYEGRALDLAKRFRRKKFRKLRKGHKTDMKSLSPKKQRIPNRVSIHDRPKMITSKRRYGDWESDLMEGRRDTKHSLSIQKERKSQYLCLNRVKDKTAEENVRAMEESLSTFPEQIRLSITYDNGSENIKHEELNKRLGTTSYFCDPYASWQKGSVENVIGLVREYLPKGTDLSEVSDEEIKVIQDKFSHRPRESLGYRTPHEVLSKKLKALGVRFKG